jgi:exopolysaccharide biosynthesis operon protein EpsL
MPKTNKNFAPRPLFPLRRMRAVLLAAAAIGLPAYAGDGDALHPFVGLGYSYDDNLLRLPDGTDFDGQRSDAMRNAIAGILFDHTYSLQDIYAQAKVNKVSFDHFKQLDYDGKDVLGRWKWHAGPHLEGTLEGEYQQVLAPYTDFHSSERNLRNEHRTFFEAMWRPHAAWRLRGAYTNDRFDYELASQQGNNRTETLGEVGIDYLARSGNYAGLVARQLKGEFPNKRRIGNFVDDQDFTQDELKARVNWKGSGITTIDILAGWARRKHALFAERDASGANGRITMTYAPRGKTTLTAAAWREFAPLESTIVSYSLNKGASLSARYDATAKLRLQASTSYEKRAYNARLNQPVALDLNDALRNHSIGLTYSPTRHIQLQLSAYHQSRSGSNARGLGSFKANGASFSANAQF